MIKEANILALTRLQNSAPRLVDICQAKDVLKDFDKKTILHAGPPIDYKNMCSPMQEAIHAALIYEDLAVDIKEARELAISGEIKYIPCHERGVVGPMTGITSWSMPLLVVENTDYGNIAYSTINEGAGDVIRFGACTENTIKRLKWIENVLAPALKKTINKMGGLDLGAMMSQSISMGDELHMRNMSSSMLLLYKIATPLSEVTSGDELIEIMKFLTTRNDQFFLNFAMAANKSSADAASNIANSTIVTTIARNGVEVGIRISGLGDKWFTAKAPVVEGLYFSGFSALDANPDLGDSAVMEINGFGGFAMAASPAIVRLIGISNTDEAYQLTKSMRLITEGEHKKYTIAGMNFTGLPLGIDLLKVIETTILPGINTAIVGKEPGIGMIGAGLSRVPYEAFEKAIIEFDRVIGEI
jgi:hypothetical protein